MSKRGNASYRSKEITIRNAAWAAIDERFLWVRTKSNGFTTIPRCFPLISQIMDNLETGKPLSNTYFALWCHIHDACYLEVQSVEEFVMESGFNGQRSKSTWLERMRKLKEHGFIDSKKGYTGEFHHILLWNPYIIIHNLKMTSKVPEHLYLALLTRMQKIGATDIEDYEATLLQQEPPLN